MAKEVIVYSQPGSRFCGRVKEFLSQKGVSYRDLDVSNDDQALEELIRLGYMTTPVTKIDGEFVVGFDLGKLETLVG